jgi:hypothetical protein
MSAGILALDIATTSGAAFAKPGGEPVWQHRRFGKVGAESGAVGALFGQWLAELIVAYAPVWMVFESPYIPPGLNNAAVRRLYGMAMIAEATAWGCGTIEVREVDTASVTKYFTGQSRWGSREGKKAATKRVCERHGWAPVTEDEADALAVFAYAEAMLFPAAASRRFIL